MQLLLATLLLSINYAITNDNNASLSSIENFAKFSHIAENVNNAHSTWRAGTNTRFNYNDDYIAALTSLQINDDEFDQLTSFNPLDIVQATVDPLPVNFTATQKWAACKQSFEQVFDQSYCGSCWAVSAATAMSDRICIKSNGADTRRISAQDILECASVLPNGCSGGSTVYAYNALLSRGFCTGDTYMSTSGCKAYQFPPCSDPAWYSQAVCRNRNTTLSCRTSCGAAFTGTYSQSNIKGKSVYRVTGGENAIMREIFTNGPVTVSMTVYEDFMAYKSGVYVYTNGRMLGGHAIKMIGWGIENGVKFWLCVNSWNRFWGDKGFFKILRGVNHMQIEGYVVAGTF